MPAISNSERAAGPPLTVEPVPTDTVVDLAYHRLRGLVLSGEVSPGSRLAQHELAERLGISRTPVREALRRLSAEGFVDAVPNRGFRVVELALDAVLPRLEARLLLEPGIARLAAERRDDEHVERLRAATERERDAADAVAAHDASRDFHMTLARAAGNPELVRVLESLWITEIGRRLLSRRSTEPDWRLTDVREHEEIAAAVKARRGARAERLMAAHVRDALRHWEPERRRLDGERDGARRT